MTLSVPALLWKTGFPRLDDYGLVIFCCILRTGYCEHIAHWTFCINLAYTIDLGALSALAVDGHSRSMHAWPIWHGLDHTLREALF